MRAHEIEQFGMVIDGGDVLFEAEAGVAAQPLGDPFDRRFHGLRILFRLASLSVRMTPSNETRSATVSALVPPSSLPMVN